MPRTEAGKGLLDDIIEWEQREYGSESDKESLAAWTAAIDAIEAEAAGEAYAEGAEACEDWVKRAVAAERARIKEAVERLPLPKDAADPTYIRGWDDGRAAVLRIIDREDTDDRP